MDLQSFCVESRRKVHSFPFLRSAVQSTEKMPKSFQFGVPVNGPMEESCYKKIPNISCNAQFTFPEITKPQECHPKRSCFDNFNKFSHFTFSRVVGGFVGSKSQGGSASREPHQVWDVILRQLVDTACGATMNNNAQQYFSIGEAVSQSIFGQFNNRNNSTLDFTSFIFTRPCDFFANKKPPGNMPSSNDGQCKIATANGHVQFSQVPCETQSHGPSVIVMNKSDTSKTEVRQLTCKQSYADVAKTFAASKPDSVYKTEKYQNIPATMPHKNIVRCHQYSGKGNEKFIKKSRLNRSSYPQISSNHSSQNQVHMKSLLHDKYEEPVPSKFSRDKFVHLRNFRVDHTFPSKMKTKEVHCNKSISSTKNPKVLEDRKRRNNRHKNPNMREKERKSIDHQVHEDIVIACNMPEEICQNWRCDHNRMAGVRKSRAEFCNPRKDFRAKNVKQQTRLYSPPPRTLVQDCVKVIKPKPDDSCFKKEVSDICENENLREETLCNNEKSTISVFSTLPRSGRNNNESSLSSSPIGLTVVLPPRSRVSSECSIDSEDSSVVFERDDHDVDDAESDNGVDSDSGSDYSSECESSDDCDEVDFCYIIPEKDLDQSTISTFGDAFSPVPDRLKDINAKWFKENALLPKEEKVPKKVHFPHAEKLAKVHHMIQWPFAYREARRGHWEEIGRDRCRFRLRIERAEQELSPVLDPKHRRRIWEERMCDVGCT